MIYNIIQTASRFESQVIERLFVEMSIWCIWQVVWAKSSLQKILTTSILFWRLGWTKTRLERHMNMNGWIYALHCALCLPPCLCLFMALQLERSHELHTALCDWETSMSSVDLHTINKSWTNTGSRRVSIYYWHYLSLVKSVFLMSTVCLFMLCKWPVYIMTRILQLIKESHCNLRLRHTWFLHTYSTAALGGGGWTKSNILLIISHIPHLLSGCFQTVTKVSSASHIFIMYAVSGA